MILNQKNDSEWILNQNPFFVRGGVAGIWIKKDPLGPRNDHGFLLKNEDVYAVSSLFERFLGPRKDPDDV